MSMIQNILDQLSQTINVRNAVMFEDIPFRILGLDGVQIGEEFPGKELPAKLDQLKADKASAVIEYHCPHQGEGMCPEVWHEYSATVNGKEYVFHYLATKMSGVGAVWIDPNDFSDGSDQGGGDEPSTTDGGEAAAEPVHSEG